MDVRNIQSVTSLDLPGLQPYRTLRRPQDHFREGIFVAEGEKVVRRLIESGLPIGSMLLTPEWFEKLSVEPGRHDFKSTIIYIAQKKLLETIVGYNLHQGIMAVGTVPRERSIDEIMRTVRKSRFLVALDGLVNAENVGMVVRNCAAFGVDALVVGETSSSPYLRRSVRNSMGTVFQLDVVHVDSLRESLRQLHHQHETRIIGAHPHERSTIFNADFSGNICLVLGNEGDGISREILEVCTHRVAIPMMKGTDSLNVASASAVFLFEAHKQRASRR